MDRIVRLYNPYIPSKPIALLKSHNTPIFFIHLSNEDNRIFTMSIDKCLNVILDILVLNIFLSQNLNYFLFVNIYA